MTRIGFGVTTGQFVPFGALCSDVLFAEELGFDDAWLVDDFDVHGVPELSMREAWTSLAGVAVSTGRIRLGAMVSPAGVRSPVMLAKSVLTVDEMSQGRVNLAVGAGFSAADHAAYGVEFLDPRGRRARLAEAVAVLDDALRGEVVDHDGAHFQISGAARVGPTSSQQPRPPLWVAAQTTASIDIAAQRADVMVSLGPTGGDTAPLDAFRARMRRADEACERVGRSPASLRRCYFAGYADEPIFASNEATADFIGRYVDAGATDFTFYLANDAAPQLHVLVDDARMATRDVLEGIATAVLPVFRTTS